MTYRILDTFCGAGGAGMGYRLAGFEVVGVDIMPQKHYPFEFHQADALEYIAEHGREFDAIHTSPPCQAYSQARAVHRKEHPDLIPVTRRILSKVGLPYVIENVVGSPLLARLLLCGTMFGLKTIRHRLFESNIDLGFPPATCSCNRQAVTGNLFNLHNTRQRKLYMQKNGYSRSCDALRDSLGVPWMSMDEAQEAIPPAYCEFIGKQLISVLDAAVHQQDDFVPEHIHGTCVFLDHNKDYSQNRNGLLDNEFF